MHNQSRKKMDHIKNSPWGIVLIEARHFPFIQFNIKGRIYNSPYGIVLGEVLRINYHSIDNHSRNSWEFLLIKLQRLSSSKLLQEQQHEFQRNHRSRTRTTIWAYRVATKTTFASRSFTLRPVQPSNGAETEERWSRGWLCMVGLLYLPFSKTLVCHQVLLFVPEWTV